MSSKGAYILLSAWCLSVKVNIEDEALENFKREGLERRTL